MRSHRRIARINPTSRQGRPLRRSALATLLAVVWWSQHASGQPAACQPSDGPAPSAYQVLADPAYNAMSTAELSTALRDKGIDDMYVIKEGGQQGQLALGLFHDRDNAGRMVDRLSGLGFEARIVVRSRAGHCEANSAAPVSAAAPGRPGASEPALATQPEEPGTPAPEAAANACAIEDEIRHLVLADPADNGGDYAALVQKLRTFGVPEAYVISSGPNRGQVLAGSHQTTDAARAQAAELTGMGFVVQSEAAGSQRPGSDCPPH